MSGLTETFIKERPLVASTEGLRGKGSSERGEVTVDDAALFVARLSGGAVATYEATRFALGRRNGLRIELNGEKGSLVFDLERLNELEVYLADDDPHDAGIPPGPRHRGRAPVHVGVVAGRVTSSAGSTPSPTRRTTS